MGLLSRVFGVKYNDGEIVARVESAISEDPLVTNAGALSVTSEKGVVTLKGTVQKAQEKDRVEGIARSVLRDSELKFERLVNDLAVR